MGQAKIRKKQKEKSLISTQEAKEKFDSVKSFPPFTYDRSDSVHAVRAYHHMMRLIFLRAKHLHQALLDSISKNNSYVTFILIKGYWETVAMMGYSYLTAKNFIQKKNYSELKTWVRKHALGGKHFVTEEMLQEKGLTREEMTQTNLITWMEKIDKDFNKKGLNKEYSFLNLYNEFIAEGGHPTFLGLSICEEKKSGFLVPNVNKISSHSDDDAMTLNHMSLANIYFFYYWEMFCKESEQQIKTAQS